MVEIADIKDHDSLRKWLKDQPREVVVAVAVRAALRVIPIWWNWTLISEIANERGLTALPVLRCALNSQIGFQIPRNVSQKASAIAAGPAIFAGDIIAAAANAVAYSGDAMFDFDSAAEATVNAAKAADIWQDIRADAENATSNDSILGRPLWFSSKYSLQVVWLDVQKQLLEENDKIDLARQWTFWIAWYQSILEGVPMLGDVERTWEMLEKIALIEPEHWEAGPGVVNPMIQEIWELYRLRVEIAALQTERDAVAGGTATIAHRSHNRPPDLVDADAELGQSITIIWDGLDEAGEELEKDEPDKGLLGRIAARLLSALSEVARYCGKVADTAVMAAAKVGGGAVGTALLDHFVNNGRLLQFAKDLAIFAGG